MTSVTGTTRMTNGLSVSEYQDFLAALAPKNAGDLFNFHFSDRSIERVGDLATITKDFILTGTVFILVPDLIKTFEKVWFLFIRSQKIDGTWTVDPLVYLSEREEDKIMLIDKPTVIGLACLLQGLVHFPTVPYPTKTTAINQAVNYIMYRIQELSSNKSSPYDWQFISWIIRVLDRPRRDEMTPLFPIFDLIKTLYNDIEPNCYSPDDIPAICETMLRLEGRILPDFKRSIEQRINENPLIKMLERRSVCHQLVTSQSISIQDFLWLPYWKLKVSCSHPQLLSTIKAKCQPIKNDQVKQLFQLIIEYQMNHFLLSDERECSNSVQR